MRTQFIVIFIFICNVTYAQDQFVEMKLNTLDNKKKTVPFFFKEVTFKPDVSDTLGIIATKKNKDNTFAMLEADKSKKIFDFLSAQFEQNHKSTPIILEIKKLKLAATDKGVFSFKDTFQFQCEFTGILNNEKVPLYTFNAKNAFGTFEDAENVMSNYITRALVSAVEKFKESYDKKAEWHQEFANESNAPQKPVKINISKNKFTGKDTLSCEPGSKLTWNDFQINPKDNTGNGSAKFILTYLVAAEETGKQLKLDIYIKAFFNKRNSWKPKGTADGTWLDYHQGHFDICAAYGNKLYNEIKNYKYSLGEYRAELNKIYNTVYTEYVKLRKQYETETGAGTNETQNIIWRKKIDDLMIENRLK